MVRRTNGITGMIDGVSYCEFSGKSTDTKPVADYIATGSLFSEIDTGDVYAYDEEGAAGSEWILFVSLGGG